MDGHELQQLLLRKGQARRVPHVEHRRDDPLICICTLALHLQIANVPPESQVLIERLNEAVERKYGGGMT